LNRQLRAAHPAAFGHHGAAKAKARGFLQAQLQLPYRPQLPAGTVLVGELGLGGQGEIAKAGHHRSGHTQICGGFFHLQTSCHSQIAVEAGEGQTQMLLQHSQDLMQAVGANAGGHAPGAGVAGGADQGLQLHHQWPRAFTGHDRGHAHRSFRAA